MVDPTTLKSSIALPFNSDITFADVKASLASRGAGLDAPAAPQDGGPGAGGNGVLQSAIAGPIPVLQTSPGPGFSGSIPPDPTTAAGPEQLVTMVNTRIAVYDKARGRNSTTRA